jgi:hypothetical protein
VPRYCSRGDDQPAAKLAASMLRLGVCRAQGWNGSAVDFVGKGLARFCRKHGSTIVGRVFPESSIRLKDDILERGEYERSRSEDLGPSSRVFLMVHYDQASMVQIGPTLTYLGSLHHDLPAAFYEVFTTNLRRWMRVYDYRDAENYAEDQIAMHDGEDLEESFYPKVKAARPSFLKDLPEYDVAVDFLQKTLPEMKSSSAAAMIQRCLAMHECGKMYKASWPSDLRDQVPEMEDYLENTDYPGPGSLIVCDEDDLIEACFSEETHYLGQDYAIGATLMVLINLDQDAETLDTEVMKVFGFLGAMLQSLSSATKLIEIIRGTYDEDLRQRRLESRVPAEQSPAGIRGERLQQLSIPPTIRHCP